MVKIGNFSKNVMGTVSFDGQFDGMRKAQDFIVYPMKEAEKFAQIQSDTRIGMINLESGTVTLSRPKPGGAYSVHLNGASIAGRLAPEDLLMLKGNILMTASANAGSRGVACDNSGAAAVFGGAA